MTTVAERPKPFVMPEYCKGCGRCITSCPKGCITMGTEINPETGLVPIVLDLSLCNGCDLCIDACPEPYGLRPEGDETAFELVDPAEASRSPVVSTHPAHGPAGYDGSFCPNASR